MTLPVNCGKRRMRLQERASCAMVCGTGRKALVLEIDCHSSHLLGGDCDTKIECDSSHSFGVDSGTEIVCNPSHSLGGSGTNIDHNPSLAFGVKEAV